MSFFRQVLSAIAFGSVLVQAIYAPLSQRQAIATADHVDAQSVLTAPSKDPWYTAPSGFEAASPGAVLRLRKAPGNLTTVYGNSSSAWNVLFRTTDSNYKPAWAVTTIFTPKTDSAKALVSYQIPYNSPWIDSSPSYTLSDPAFYTGLVQSDIQTLLSYGWYVNVPDHEGPLAAFACCVSEGHATLDSVRAVKSLKQAWAPGNGTQVALWGYSGGSLASEFASELQVQYAPELEIAGTAIGGLPVNASTALELSSGTSFAGLVAAGLLGISKQHADANKTLYESLKQTGPYNATTFLSALHMTVADIFTLFAGQDMSQYFVDGFAIFNNPSVQKAGDNDALMGYHGTPQMPLFVYKAAADELGPIGQTDALVDRYCGVGANIVYQKNSIGGHLAEETNADASALAWLRSVLGRSYNHTGCTVENVALNVTDSPL